MVYTGKRTPYCEQSKSTEIIMKPTILLLLIALSGCGKKPYQVRSEPSQGWLYYIAYDHHGIDTGFEWFIYSERRGDKWIILDTLYCLYTMRKISDTGK